MKLSLASAGVAAGLVTLGWIIFGEEDTKNAESFAEESFDCSVCDKAIYEKDDPQDDELCDDCFKTHKPCAVCQDYELYNEMTSCFTCGQNYCADCDKYDSCEDMEAEYQPTQTLEDYDEVGLTHSSAIDGYQPFKYSVMTSRAETSFQDFQDAIFSAIKPRNAVAVLAPNDNGVAGVVHFSQEEDTVHIDYDITGLTDGEHGFHIHTYGDLTDGCDSACSHFNPDNTEHGGLDSKSRHLGDLGNISSEKGVSKGRLSTDTLSLKSGKRNCIVGRMIIVHADRDDLGKGGDAESLKTGNAGKRVGCGVIGLAKGEVKCAETLEAEKDCSWCKKKSAKVRDVEYGGGGSICPNCHYAYRKLGYNPHKSQHPFKKSAEHKKMNPIEKPMISGVTSSITADGLEDLMMAEDKATPIRHSRRLNGYYGIKGYEDASEDGFIYRIYRSPGTNDWFKAMVYDDNSRRESGAKHTSRRLNPSGQMSITNDPAYLLIGAFPKLEDAKRALVFRMIQDGNYHHMITDGNLKWLLKGNR